MRRVVGMEIVSGIGDGVFWVGLAALLVERGATAGAFALAAAARLGPRALISAPAGLLADRVDRRRLLAGLDVARAAMLALLALATIADVATGVLLLVVLLSYTVAAPYRPALTAALPLVAGEDSLSSVNAMVSTVRQLMTFVGPVVGAVIVRWSSPSVAFAVDAATFVAAGWLIAGVAELAGHPSQQTRHKPVRGDWRAEIGAGWREIRATAGLAAVTVLILVMDAARGAELVLLVLLADQRLGLGSAGVGVLTGAVGLGALVVLPTGARVAETNRPALVIVVGLATTAVPFVLFAAIRSPVAACLCLLVVGAGVVAFEVLSVVLLQRLTRRNLLGRVFGVIGMASNAGRLVGALAAPALVAVAGLGGAFAAIGLAVGTIGVAAIPSLIALGRATSTRRDQLRPIANVLASLGLFEGASRAVLERVAAELTETRVQPSSVVIREGDPADDLFIVREGHFRVTVRGQQVNAMAPGDWFGEIGLLQRRPRTATVVASTDALLWCVPGATFLDALRGVASEPSALIDVMADRVTRV